MRDAEKSMPEPLKVDDGEYGPAYIKPSVIVIPGKAIIAICKFFKRILLK